MPVSNPHRVIRFTHFMTVIAAVAVVALSGAATAFAADDQPVRVFTVPSSGSVGVRALLGDTLGDVAATAPASVPRGVPAQVADTLPVVDSGSRQYGKIRVDAFRLADEQVAYALVRFLRPADAQAADTGEDAWETGAETAVRQGVFTLVLQGGDRSARAELARVIVARIGQRPVEVHLVKSLPDQDRVAGSERYAGSFESLRRLRPDLASDVYRIGAGGADAVFADYEQPNGQAAHLLIVEYQTPHLAGEAERSLTAYYDGLAPEAKADRFFKREGNYLIEGTGAADREAFRRKADTVVYAYGIKWIGEPPPTLLQLSDEAHKAALVFINSFAIVGAAFAGAIACGLVFGVVIFRRRRRAAAAIFSDAGGMVHLELGPVNFTRGDSVGLLTEESRN